MYNIISSLWFQTQCESIRIDPKFWLTSNYSVIFFFSCIKIRCTRFDTIIFFYILFKITMVTYVKNHLINVFQKYVVYSDIELTQIERHDCMRVTCHRSENWNKKKKHFWIIFYFAYTSLGNLIGGQVALVVRSRYSVLLWLKSISTIHFYTILPVFKISFIKNYYYYY